ncbi:MAG: M28 family peptidase [Gelidibacter sp.]|uniref:M28 family peptidase n=1 Tax=Gelidibacter sp. TaxID=2018083 RepID=UPI003264B223
MQKLKFLSLLLLVFLWSSCQTEPKKKNNSDEFGAKEEATYRKALSTLASDELMGRKPFTEGEDRTLNYLKGAFESLGLEPGNGNSFFQDVPMVEIKNSFKDDKVIITKGKAKIELDYLTDIVGGTRRVVEDQKIEGVEMVFVGFGIDAPEYHWNDYEGIDVKGKIVVVMINDPGFYNSDLFRGKDVTYYGRWTYKFEEAARKGAEGVLIIHDTKPAAYDWSVVRSSWSKSKLFLQTENDNMNFCALEGWVSGPAADKLFNLAGIKDSKELFEKAKQPGFKPVSLGATLNLTLKNEIKKSVSRNVLAKITGNERADEFLIFSAHWDHFGVGEKIDGDSIYNGAADNATGVAALLALAEKFKESPKLERSLLFFSPTGEEAGLLGSEYYATHPIYPLNKTVVDINFDVLQPFGLMKDIFIIGKGQSEVDAYLEKEAEKEGRIVRAVDDPSDGWYYRSDHFNFAKVGVPTLYVANGMNSFEHGEEWGIRQKEEYTRLRYHKPQDNYDASWDVSGTMADLKLIYRVGQNLGNSSDFPKWNDGVMYKRIREKQ